MMLTPTLLVGDTHADFDGYKAIIRNAERAEGRALPSIHVGDYGFGHFSDREADEAFTFHQRNPQHRFLRGNHDRPDLVQQAPGFLPDGMISGSVLFLGGADGGSFGWLTELSEKEMAEILAQLHHCRELPSVIISHDAPQKVAVQLCASRAEIAAVPQMSRTREFLSKVHELVQPELWIFGHWHYAWAAQIGATHFRAMGFSESFVLPLPWHPKA